MTHEWFADENRDLLRLVVALGRNPADIAPVYLESARAVLDAILAEHPVPLRLTTVEEFRAVDPDVYPVIQTRSGPWSTKEILTFLADKNIATFLPAQALATLKEKS